MKKKLLGLLAISACAISLASCQKNTKEDYKCTAVAPKGAPALALQGVAISDNDSCQFIAASTITDQFVSNQYDVVIAPVNAGAVSFKKEVSTYKLAAVVTWGNLYFATQRTDINSIEDLNGKDVEMFGEKTINSSIAKYVLASKNITPNYSYKVEAAQTQDTLVNSKDAIVLCAEPAISAGAAKNNITVKTFSVQDLYKEVSGGSEFTQAGLFVKADTITNHKSELDAFLSKIEQSCNMISEDADKTAENIIALGNTGLPTAAPMIKKVLPKCNVKYVKASTAKAQVEATANIDLSKFGGAVPSDEFYYS